MPRKGYNTPKQIANLVRPAKGTTPNPNGRPKGSRNKSTVVRELLSKIADMEKFSPNNAAKLKAMGIETKTDFESLMTAAQLVKAIAGDSRAYEVLMDNGYGKSTQPIDHTTQGDKVTLLPAITIERKKK